MQFNTISVSTASLGFDRRAGQRTQIARHGPPVRADVKEIERLIKRLEFDKEILADPDAEKDEAAN